jgi:hypothetical protein
MCLPDANRLTTCMVAFPSCTINIASFTIFIG